MASFGLVKNKSDSRLIYFSAPLLMTIGESQ